jgi:SHS2 domain-containing protein
MPQARYEFLDAVTSDLCFVARADTLEGVFAAAADALVSVTAGDPERVRELEERPLSLEEPDLELLMLAFLSELVFLRDAHELLLRPKRLRIQRERSARLEARLVGEKFVPTHHWSAIEVKAVTAHGLRVACGADGWEARVTLDV